MRPNSKVNLNFKGDATFILSKVHVPALSRYLKVGIDPEMKTQSKRNNI